MTAPRHPHKYEEMLPEEVWAEMERAPVIYLPVGPLENHGPHNAMGMDALRPYNICLMAAAASGGIVHPPLYVGLGGSPGKSRAQVRKQYDQLYPPSVFVSREVCALLYEELFETFADLGFKVCMAYGGHGPCAHSLMQIAERLAHRLEDMRIWAGGEATFDLSQVRDPDPGQRAMDHGGKYETSMLMAYRPELVHLDRFWELHPDGKFGPQWQISQEHRLHEARIELGERYNRFMAEQLAQWARQLLAEA